MSWHQGEYQIVNKDKYIGSKNPFFKSNLENRMNFWLDHNKNVIKWGYEKLSIPYLKPIFENFRLHHLEEHQYYLDYWAEIIDKQGKTQRYLIEVKSHEHTKPPIEPKKKNPKSSQRYAFECITFSINQNKWKFAKKFAEDKGWKFVIITDLDIY